ncbi:MAG TPA: 16S rRNA (uracil(1498)-N(3))-methyltransferase [Holophagaceae bacterium]|nr:16S rRNA (uracil(1498)-N(3))-methyltransferase [Holophagaceae bacterium]
MNLLLLEPGDLLAPDRARISGRRLVHAREILKAQGGSTLKAGLVDGPLGTARVMALEGDHLDLELALDQVPPPKIPLTLLLALPRPKVLNRVLASAASLGVARIVLLNAWKVEKAYWKSPRMAPQNLRDQLILGLEQARDTVLPEVRVERLFKPFVAERLPALLEGARGLVADPSGAGDCPRSPGGPLVLAVGPEGGWIPAELESLRRAGCEAVNLGPRILRTETALACLVGRLA